MKAPVTKGDKGVWERTISRYLHGNGIPLTWKGQITGFTGISGYVFRRIAPKRAKFNPEETWGRMPRYFRERSDHHNMIVIVTNRDYGDLEDSLVVMKLSTFAPIFSTHINSDRERYIDASHRDR